MWIQSIRTTDPKITKHLIALDVSHDKARHMWHCEFAHAREDIERLRAEVTSRLSASRKWREFLCHRGGSSLRYPTSRWRGSTVLTYNFSIICLFYYHVFGWYQTASFNHQVFCGIRQIFERYQISGLFFFSLWPRSFFTRIYLDASSFTVRWLHMCTIESFMADVQGTGLVNRKARQ